MTTPTTPEGRIDFDEAELGRVIWHSSEDEGGPDVGLQLGLGDGRSLYLGEMPNATLEEAGIGQEYPDGWWLVLYGADRPDVAASVCDMDAARTIFDLITELATSKASLLAALEEAEDRDAISLSVFMDLEAAHLEERARAEGLMAVIADAVNALRSAGNNYAADRYSERAEELAATDDDEPVASRIAALTARAEASEQREAGLVAEAVERFSDAIDAAHRINAWIDAIAAADADVVPSREIRRYTFNEDDGGAVLYFRDNQVAAGAFVVRDLWNFTVSMKVFAALTHSEEA